MLNFSTIWNSFLFKENGCVYSISFLFKVETYKNKLDSEVSSAKRIEELEQQTAEYEKQKVNSFYINNLFVYILRRSASRYLFHK